MPFSHYVERNEHIYFGFVFFIHFNLLSDHAIFQSESLEKAESGWIANKSWSIFYPVCIMFLSEKYAW